MHHNNCSPLGRTLLFSLLLLLVSCTPRTASVVSQPDRVEEKAATAATTEAQDKMEEGTASATAAEPQEKMEEAAPEEAPSNPMLQPIPLDPRVRMGQLDNGLKYYIQANQKPENRAELRLAVGVGSINEDDDQLGLAHFVEHMAFNGTKNFEKSEIVDYLQSVGTRFGPDLNAYTSFDETVYMLQVRTDSQELLDKGMLILEDWSHAITFEGEEIDKERGVVESELRSGLSADERMRNKYLPVIFHESKYAERLPIGTREIINNAPYSALTRYYKDWYRPDLMAVVVVGDIDVDEMEQDITRRFSKLTNPASPRQREKFDFPDHDETLVVVTKDKEAAFTTASVYYKHKNKRVRNLMDYRRSLVQSLYNRMLNNRLDELRQSSEPPFIYGYSGYGRQVGDLDTYTSYVSTGEGQAMKGLEAVLVENKRALDHGFTQSELDRTRIEMLSEAETAAKEEDKTQSGTLSMRYVYHYLNENPVPSPTQRHQLQQALLPTIQIAEINDLARTWITDGSNRVVVVTGPDKEEVPLPTEAEILSLIKAVDAREVSPYEDNVANVPLMEAAPAAGSVASAKTIESIGVTEWTLSNGVRVVLKPTDFQNDEINFTAFSPGGHSIYGDEDYRSASLASAIVNQSGVGPFDLIQLQKVLAGKQVQAGPFISELEEGMQGFSTIKDLETMFQLIHLYFTAPREDEAAFSSLMSRQKQVLQNLFVNPTYYFRNRATKLKYKDHLRRGIPTVEDLESVSLEKVTEVYRDRFADAGDFTFIFVGNFDEASIKPLILKYLASLPSTGRQETWKDVDASMIKGRHIDRFSYGEAPKAQVEMNWHGGFDWDIREDRYHLNALMEVLRNKLRESMREDQGGVYGVRVSGRASKEPREGYGVTISFNAEPTDVDTLIRTALSEIQKVMEEGASDEDIVKVVEVQRQSRIKGLKENNFWTNSLRSYYSYGLDAELLLLENYEPLLENLDSDDIQQMATRLFDTDNYIEIVMMPEEGGE